MTFNENIREMIQKKIQPWYTQVHHSQPSIFFSCKCESWIIDEKLGERYKKSPNCILHKDSLAVET
jgi:hypothetical protein